MVRSKGRRRGGGNNQAGRGGGNNQAGRGGGNNQAGRGGGRGGFVPSAVEYQFMDRPGARGRGGSDIAFKSFSMQEEAMNTERRHGWTAPLRNVGINFVAAGTLRSDQLLEQTVVDPEEVDPSADKDTSVVVDVVVDSSPLSAENGQDSTGDDIGATIDVGKLDLGTSEEKPELQQEAPVESHRTMPEQENPGFILDLTGDADVSPKIKNTIIREPSPSPSVSSTASERIVFIPRGKRGAPQLKNTKRQPSPPQPAINASVPTIHTHIGPAPELGVQARESIATMITIPLEPKIIKNPKSKDLIEPNGQSRFNGKRATPGNKRRKPRGGRRDRGDEKATEDYMENIVAQMRIEAADAGGETSMDGAGLLRDLGGIDQWDSSTDEDDDASDSEAVRRHKNGWDEDFIKDLEDISTDEEGPRGLIARLLGKRTRPSGLQYLIKWDGYETDDATWTLAKVLDLSANAKVKKYEARLFVTEAQLGKPSGFESEYEDDGSEGADEDEDLKLARFLQKEAELELVRGGNDFSELMDLDDFFAMGASERNKNKRKSVQGIADITADPSTGRFPSASKMAAAYEGFDVMDWERPSIVSGRKRKGKGEVVECNLSDPILEAQWKRDRLTKKQRKAQREELRAQGLLGKKGKKTGKPNFNERNPEGITMAQAEDEIRSFMLTEQKTTLCLPHMSREDRKMIHQRATELNLKSKSTGHGKRRYTTITKTSQSSIYEHNEESIDSVLRKGFSGSRFEKGKDVSGGGDGRKRGGGSVRGRNKEGMVVGAEAPELSATNKGRLMLEKMGYKAGMSLGVEGNRGISEPIVAIVKMSKAGLGKGQILQKF